jgi:hypothetical protein
MMEGIFQTMLFFFGVKLLLSKQDKDMSKGKRGKRANKYSTTEQELHTVVRKSERQKAREEKANQEKIKKPFEDIKLLPARDAQGGKI